MLSFFSLALIQPITRYRISYSIQNTYNHESVRKRRRRLLFNQLVIRSSPPLPQTTDVKFRTKPNFTFIMIFINTRNIPFFYNTVELSIFSFFRRLILSIYFDFVSLVKLQVWLLSLGKSNDNKMHIESCWCIHLRVHNHCCRVQCKGTPSTATRP